MNGRLTLVDPPSRYDQREMREMNRRLEAADADNLKRGADIDLGLRARYIIRDADGVPWKLVVATDGTLSTAPL